MKSKFDNEKFIQFRDKLMLSTRYYSEDIGVVQSCNGQVPLDNYLILIDGKLYVIRSESSYHHSTNINAIFIINKAPKHLLQYGDCFIRERDSKNYTNSYYSVSKEQHEKISDYIANYNKVTKIKKKEEKEKAAILKREAQAEEERLKREAQEEEERLKQETQNRIDNLLLSFNTLASELLEDENIQIMITNFMRDTLDDFFIDPSIITLLIDRLHSEFFETKKINRGFYLKDHAIEFVIDRYKKIINLFVHKKLFNLNKYSISFYNIVLTHMIRNMSQKVYGKEFEDSFLGYFLNIEEMTYEDCINAYFTIDIINPLAEKNLSLFTYFLILHRKIRINGDEDLYYDGINSIKKDIENLEANKELVLFEQQLLKKKSILGTERLNIDTTDLMNGSEFETFISELFRKMGYSVQLTKQSGDQGIDVIAVKNGIRYGIQTKCYSSPVSNKAIQEVVAGVSHYKLDKGLVITNNFFTDSARQLAASNEIILWDRQILKEKISDYLLVK